MTNEQSQAVFQNEGNILVSASAGSGKTFTMIERVKRLILEENVSVNEILAVTFTEMAAAEMKEKLKRALSDNCLNENKSRIYSEIALLANSDISTLHAFCARLIRSYFFAVGLSPDFAIADEGEAKTLKKQSIDKTFKEFYDKGEDWFYKIVDRHASKRDDNSLKELILSAYSFCDSEEDPKKMMDICLEECSKENYERLKNEYKNHLNSYLEELINDCSIQLALLDKDKLEKGLEYTKTLLSDLKHIYSSQDIYVIKKSIEILNIRFNFDRKLTAFQEEIKEKVKSIRDKFKKIIERFSANLATDANEDMIRLEKAKEHAISFNKILNRFYEIYQNEKREENLLDFNDLEHFALKILSIEEIKNDIKSRYKYIFVDEYQDINGVQEKIISLLENNNLFMVGDVKQSIYGFRGCRPEFFSNKFDKMKSLNQSALTLNHNFRSAKNVIDMVNKIFSYSMTKKYFGFDYKGNSELVSGNVYKEQYQGRAMLHILEKEEKKEKEIERPRIYNILEEIHKENEEKDNHISSLITDIINGELGKEYYDLKEQKLKHVQYEDIVILTRNKNNSFVAKLVKGLLSHGIPVISDVKENICDFKEISMLINALKLVNCFRDDIPLASTLKSPIGKFSDEDLAQIVCYFSDSEKAKEQRDWTFFSAFNYYLENADTLLNKRLKEFKNRFDEIRKISDFIGAEGTLNKLIEQNDLESYLFAEHNGKTKVNRLRKLVSASVVGGKKLSIMEFLSRIENSKESFMFADCADEKAVKVMTIHASKGLEFPVVIVAGLERNMNDEEEYGDIIFSREKGFAFKGFFDGDRTKTETIERAVIKEQMRLDRIKEELRLFYVATTRATYSLHLTVEGDIKERKEIFSGADKFIDYVPNGLMTTIHNPQELAFLELKQSAQKVIVGQSDEKVKEQLKNIFAYSYPYMDDTTLPLKMGVTSAISNDDNEGIVHLLFDEPTPDKEKGIIAHAIMENMDFNSQDDIYMQTTKMQEKGILSKQDIDKINLDRLNKVLKNEAFKLIKDYNLYREHEFFVSAPANMIKQTSSKEQVVLQGIIDLLAIKNDKAIIIDYKYSSLDAKSLKAKYHKQLELYAYALKKILNKDIQKLMLVNLFTGESIEV